MKKTELTGVEVSYVLSPVSRSLPYKDRTGLGPVGLCKCSFKQKSFKGQVNTRGTSTLIKSIVSLFVGVTTLEGIFCLVVS